MTANHAPRMPITHRTSTTAQRLRHASHHEQEMNWGAIGKTVLVVMAAFAVLYCAAAMGW